MTRKSRQPQPTEPFIAALQTVDNVNGRGETSERHARATTALRTEPDIIFDAGGFERLARNFMLL